MTAIEQLRALLDWYDGDLNFEVGSGCMWSGQLRLTLTDPDNAPSQSITFYGAGGSGPEEVAEEICGAVHAWLPTAETEPLPVPDWKRG